MTYEALLKAKFYDLLDDAAERGDIAAIDWLEKQQNEMVDVNRANGTVEKRRKGLFAIRKEYGEQFLGFDKAAEAKAAAKAAAKAKADKERAELFAAARAKAAAKAK